MLFRSRAGGGRGRWRNCRDRHAGGSREKPHQPNSAVLARCLEGAAPHLVILSRGDGEGPRTCKLRYANGSRAVRRTRTMERGSDRAPVRSLAVCAARDDKQLTAHKIPSTTPANPRNACAPFPCSAPELLTTYRVPKARERAAGILRDSDFGRPASPAGRTTRPR